MKWVGELYIIPRNENPAYIFDNGEPDAFVETETKQEVYNMLAHYDMTMGKDDDILIIVRKKAE